MSKDTHRASQAYGDRAKNRRTLQIPRIRLPKLPAGRLITTPYRDQQMPARAIVRDVMPLALSPEFTAAGWAYAPWITTG